MRDHTAEESKKTTKEDMKETTLKGRNMVKVSFNGMMGLFMKADSRKAAYMVEASSIIPNLDITMKATTLRTTNMVEESKKVLMRHIRENFLRENAVERDP